MRAALPRTMAVMSSRRREDVSDDRHHFTLNDSRRPDAKKTKNSQIRLFSDDTTCQSTLRAFDTCGTD